MQDLIRPLVTRNGTKIVLLVMDGLGGLPWPEGTHMGKTELEAASTPRLDALARVSACGLHLPVAPAVTPGSGPGHLGLFGYDPKKFQIGRGILEALGLGMEIGGHDIAVRCNYSTMRDGIIVDRRAGRIPTPESGRLTAMLGRNIARIGDAEVSFGPGMEHRFAVRMRFPEPLKPGSAAINDTDPQKTGRPPMRLQASSPQAGRVAKAAEALISKAQELLKGEEKANYILLRGFSEKPQMPGFEEAYGLRALAIAPYPMYRGVAKLVGMAGPAIEGDLKEEVAFLRQNYEEYDFFFMHVKKVDSFGEDGNFEAKAKKIEEVDEIIPEVLSLNPDVLIVTGDHSTPARMREHSWHPVPVLIHSASVLGGTCAGFSERECLKGELGIFPTTSLMPFALANCGRLKKFGA